MIREDKNFTLLVCDSCNRTLWRIPFQHNEKRIISTGFITYCTFCPKPKKDYLYCEKCGQEYDENITPNGYVGDDKVCIKCLNESLSVGKEENDR